MSTRFDSYITTVKQKRGTKSTENQGPAGLRLALPLPKKAAASIRDVPLSVPKEMLPNELVRVLKKSLHNMGHDIVADYVQVFSPLKKRFAEEFQQGSVADAFEHAGKMLGAILYVNPTFAATVPVVLKRSDTQTLELIGSGVLVRIINRTFLLTAAHVTDRQSEGKLLIPGQGGFMPANGYFSAMRLPASGRRADDKLDVAFFSLDDDCVSNLHSRCTILGRRDVSLEAEPLRRTDYTFAGFPWRKSNVKRASIETAFQTFTGVEAKKSEYQELGLTRSRHIAIRFHRKRVFSHTKQMVISLH